MNASVSLTQQYLCTHATANTSVGLCLTWILMLALNLSSGICITKTSNNMHISIFHISKSCHFILLLSLLCSQKQCEPYANVYLAPLMVFGKTPQYKYTKIKTESFKCTESEECLFTFSTLNYLNKFQKFGHRTLKHSAHPSKLSLFSPVQFHFMFLYCYFFI
jgi:hypothetical protein